MIEFLQVTLWIALVFSIAAYLVMDGFDLGLGLSYLFHKSRDRSLILNSIAPFWDGNEVWLIIVLGLLFGVFPLSYSVILSSLYNFTIIYIMLIALRAAAIEFRSKVRNRFWRAFWDISFSFSSIVMLFSIGVIGANFLLGFPLDKYGNIDISFLDLFTPYSILTGVASVVVLSMHGELFLLLRIGGRLVSYEREIVKKLFLLYLPFILILASWTYMDGDVIIGNFHHHPTLLILPISATISLCCIPFFFSKERYLISFFLSSLSIASWVFSYGVAIFPMVVKSTIADSLSYNIWDHSSGYISMLFIAIITYIMVPIIIGYNIFVYYSMRAKVSEEDSY